MRTVPADIGRFLIGPNGGYTASFIVRGKRLAGDDRPPADDVVKVLLAAGGG